MKTSAAWARPDRWKREDVSQIRQTVLMFKIACNKLAFELLSLNQNQIIQSNRKILLVSSAMNSVTDPFLCYYWIGIHIFNRSVSGNTEKRQKYIMILIFLFNLEFEISGPTYTSNHKRIRNTALFIVCPDFLDIQYVAV